MDSQQHLHHYHTLHLHPPSHHTSVPTIIINQSTWCRPHLRPLLSVFSCFLATNLCDDLTSFWYQELSRKPIRFFVLLPALLPPFSQPPHPPPPQARTRRVFVDGGLLSEVRSEVERVTIETDPSYRPSSPSVPLVHPSSHQRKMLKIPLVYPSQKLSLSHTHIIHIHFSQTDRAPLSF